MPYLSSNGGRFQHVYVALEPFRLLSGELVGEDEADWDNDVERHVSWTEIAALCGIPSLRAINRALMSKPPNYISEELRSPADRAKLDSLARSARIALPEEGRMSEPVLLAIHRMLDATATPDVWISENFGVRTRRIPSGELVEAGGMIVAQVGTPDAEFYASIWVNYSYTLLFQTAAHRRRFDPSVHREGFEADETTDDFWGVRFPPTI